MMLLQYKLHNNNKLLNIHDINTNTWLLVQIFNINRIFYQISDKWKWFYLMKLLPDITSFSKDANRRIPLYVMPGQSKWKQWQKKHRWKIARESGNANKTRHKESNKLLPPFFIISRFELFTCIKKCNNVVGKREIIHGFTKLSFINGMGKINFKKWLIKKLREYNEESFRFNLKSFRTFQILNMITRSCVSHLEGRKT